VSYQRLLDEEMGTPPPSTVDVERTIRRRRRIGRFQRVAVGASALGALALVATVALRPDAAGPQFGGPGPAVPVSPSATASSAAPAPGEDGPPRIDEPAAVRLTEVLKARLAARLPGAQFLTNRVRPPEAVDALVFNHRYREPAATRGGEDYYFATADVKTAAGTGSIMVMVGRIDPDLFQVRAQCDDEGPLDAKGYECVPSTGPRAETVTTSDTRGTEKITYDIAVIRPDGIGVMIYVSNATFEDTHNDRRSAPLPPLTKEQAKDLALDPELTV
jgi:hypothetical protein